MSKNAIAANYFEMYFSFRKKFIWKLFLSSSKRPNRQTAAAASILRSLLYSFGNLLSYCQVTVRYCQDVRFFVRYFKVFIRFLLGQFLLGCQVTVRLLLRLLSQAIVRLQVVIVGTIGSHIMSVLLYYALHYYFVIVRLSSYTLLQVLVSTGFYQSFNFSFILGGILYQWVLEFLYYVFTVLFRFYDGDILTCKASISTFMIKN